MKGSIGAATYNATSNNVKHQHLGKDTHFNVTTAEIDAIQLAIETLRDCHECTVYDGINQ